MSSDRYSRPLSLTLWYSGLFVAGSLVIVSLTYVLTSISLAQRDQQIIHAKLGEYATVYERSGLRGLVATVQAEQRAAPERLFVRVAGRGADAIVVSDSEGWDVATLETASLRLLDGTLVQVGKSTEARRELLARFRAALGLVTLSIIAVALTGGWLATRSALRPIAELTTAVRRVIDTGHTAERVPVGPHDDAIDRLTTVFNEMLEKIDRLVAGMRGALDSVSHDLRTPLTRLRGTAELALAGEPNLERYRDALADCVEESDRVLVMLNTLMDISEAESGAMPLSREPTPLADVAARALELYRDVAEGKGVELVSETDPTVVVSADRVRLEQVAANLLDNAVKYTPAGGRVALAVRHTDGTGRFEVRDTGPGIPASELPHIWERLFRGDTSRTERGLGLGLSLVKAIVEAHGGAVEVTSEPGQGSTFAVLLPLIAPAPST